MGEDKNDFTSGFVGTLAFLTKCNQSVNKFLKIDLHYFIPKMLYKPLLLIYALHDLVKELIDYELRTQKRHFRLDNTCACTHSLPHCLHLYAVAGFPLMNGWVCAKFHSPVPGNERREKNRP